MRLRIGGFPADIQQHKIGFIQLQSAVHITAIRLELQALAEPMDGGIRRCGRILAN
jgi:hypothetical protein